MTGSSTAGPGNVSSSTSQSSSSSPVTFIPSAAALQTGDIRTHIHVVLDLQTPKYSEWRDLFMVHLGRCDLRHHVNGAYPDHYDLMWTQEDFIVLQWLYTTITKELFQMVMRMDATAYAVWIALESLFRGNKPTRIVHLEAELRGTIQGDMAVSAFCHRLKALSDALADVSSPISDQTLVLTLLRGLNDKFSVQVSMTPLLRPFPTFLDAHSAMPRRCQLAVAARQVKKR